MEQKWLNFHKYFYWTTVWHRDNWNIREKLMLQSNQIACGVLFYLLIDWHIFIVDISSPLQLTTMIDKYSRNSPRSGWFSVTLTIVVNWSGRDLFTIKQIPHLIGFGCNNKCHMVNSKEQIFDKNIAIKLLPGNYVLNWNQTLTELSLDGSLA